MKRTAVAIQVKDLDGDELLALIEFLREVQDPLRGQTSGRADART
jgi:hypothetical protein